MGGQGNMLGNVAQQIGGAQIPTPPGRGQALSAGGQMRIPQQPMQGMQPPMQPSMAGGGGKSGGMGQPMGQATYGPQGQSFGMGRFGQMPTAYQPPAYQPAIFQPPQLAPVNQDLVVRPQIFGGSGGPSGPVDPDAWRYGGGG